MIVVIVGPTGVGKTKMSIELAKYLDAPVINADAVQVYKGLDIRLKGVYNKLWRPGIRPDRRRRP